MMRVAVIGLGLVGSALVEELHRAQLLEIMLASDVDPQAPGLARARSYGIPTSIGGAEAMLSAVDSPEVVFDASTVAAQRMWGPRLVGSGMRVIDLTQGEDGPPVVPSVNLRDLDGRPTIRIGTCVAQAAVPIVAAISAMETVEYAEVVSTIPSVVVGCGARASINEFTCATASALETVGGAEKGKAIAVVSPADPPLTMRVTLFLLVRPDVDRSAITHAVQRAVADVSRHVPAYRLAVPTLFDETDDERTKVTVLLDVAGNGDVLPTYAGSADLVTSAALVVAEELEKGG